MTLTALPLGIYAAYRVDSKPIRQAFLDVKKFTDNTKLYEPRAHVTVIYSTAPFTPHAFIRAKTLLNGVPNLTAIVTKVSAFDSTENDSCSLVLEVKCPELLELHQKLLAQGLTHPYTPFSPHVSLGYGVPHDVAHGLLIDLQTTIGTKLLLDAPYVEELKP